MSITFKPKSNQTVNVLDSGKNFLIATFLLFITYFSQAQSVSVTNVTNPVCAGSTATITFNTNSGNGVRRIDNITTFTVYLSPQGGIGIAYTLIGSLNTSLNTTPFCTSNNCNTTGVTGTISIPFNTSAGNYRISLSSNDPAFNGSTGSGASPLFFINGAPNAPTNSGNQTITYGSATPALSATVPLGQTIDWYDVATGGAPIPSGTGTTSYNPPQTAAGTYTYYAVARNTTTGCISGTRTAVTLTINKKLLTVTVTGQSKIYDGSTTAPVVLTTDKLNADNVTAAYTSANFNDKNAGTNKSINVSGISITGTAANNYTLSNVTATTSANITAKALTLSGAAAISKEYNKTTAATITGTLSGIVAGDDITFNGSGTFATLNAGNSIAVTSNSTLAGANAGNYTLTQPTGLAANITPKPLTITGVSAVSKIYNGLTSAALSGTATLNGVIVGDDITLITSGAAASFANKLVGTNKPVTVTGYVITGTNPGNYSLSQPTGFIATISVLSITGSIIVANKIYDGNTTATINSYSLTGVISGDAVIYTGGSAAFNNKNAGSSKAVNATGLSITGADAPNYTVNLTAATTASITPKAITGSFTAKNKAYDGNANADVLTRSVTGVISGDVVSLIGGTATFNNPTIGDGKPVTLVGATLNDTDAPNYTLSSVTTTTANIYLDTDGDGIADTNDLDDDNDGIPDALESNGDRDGDGIVNSLDLDSDGDGITDAVEANKGLVPSSTYYSISTGRYFGSVGSNGLLDVLETTPDSGTLATAFTPLDTDKDGLLDFLDLDSDNDGLSDNLESQGNGTARRFPAGADTDQDGINDQYDFSSGGMGISPIQSDNDDNQPDYIDLDSDSDKKSDFVEAYDLNKDGRSLDDLKSLASTFSSNAGSTPAANYYINQNLDSNNIPGWLQDDDKNGLLNYLDTSSSYYHDSDNDGWIDLFDVTNYNNELIPNTAFRENLIIVSLPVELLNFKAQVTKNGNLLTWQTAAEQQNDYFLIKRSANGNTFETIGKVTGAGNSNQLINYSFSDNHPLSGTNYYRLKQVSSGKPTTAGPIVSVESPTITQVSSRAYPNPTLGTFNLEVTLPAAKELTITIREITGKLIQVQTAKGLAGRNAIALDLTQAANGVYIITIQGLQLQQALYLVKGY